MKNSLFMICFLLILCFALFLSGFNFNSVEAQVATNRSTTANVTVSGFLGAIIVIHNPVNFTMPGTDGLQPATSLNVKRNADNLPYITINTTTHTNVNYTIYMNASDLTDGMGHSIPVNNLRINATCDGALKPTLKTLSTGLIEVCGDPGISKWGSANVYFYLDVPAGQYNNTYYGHIWIYINSSQAWNNRTWYGPNNTTAAIKKYIEWDWVDTPISFGTTNPGYPYNATPGAGWPANISNGAATNVYVDIYLNGTDLIEQTNPTLIIGITNISYSNATALQYWPNATRTLSYNLPPNPTRGDFANWGMVPNRTDIMSWWNITIPGGQPGGTYVGIVNGKLVDAGTDPTP